MAGRRGLDGGYSRPSVGEAVLVGGHGGSASSPGEMWQAFGRQRVNFVYSVEVKFLSLVVGGRSGDSGVGGVGSWRICWEFL